MLPVEKSQLAVQIANGDTLPCLGCCKSVVLQLQNFQFMVGLYILPLGGCDIVLGVDWLRSLGTILWNFAELNMQFSFNGTTMHLHGMKPPDIMLEEEHLVSKLTGVERRGMWLQVLEAGPVKKQIPLVPAIRAILDEIPRSVC